MPSITAHERLIFAGHCDDSLPKSLVTTLANELHGVRFPNHKTGADAANELKKKDSHLKHLHTSKRYHKTSYDYFKFLLLWYA